MTPLSLILGCLRTPASDCAVQLWGSPVLVIRDVPAIHLPRRNGLGSILGRLREGSGPPCQHNYCRTSDTLPDSHKASRPNVQTQLPLLRQPRRRQARVHLLLPGLLLPMQRHQLLRLPRRRVEQSRRPAAPHAGSLPESPSGPLDKRIAGHLTLLSLCIGYVDAETLTLKSNVYLFPFTVLFTLSSRNRKARVESCFHFRSQLSRWRDNCLFRLLSGQMTSFFPQPRKDTFDLS